MSSAARHRCAFLIATAVPLIACHGPHPGSMTSSEPTVTRIGAYLASDPSSGSRDPASVLVPNGPSADIDDAWSGHLPYDPARITAPTLIVRGAWETVTTDADARWLYDALRSAPLKRDVKIDRGTHVMHLEASRRQLYREVAAFLTADHH